MEYAKLGTPPNMPTKTTKNSMYFDRYLVNRNLRKDILKMSIRGRVAFCVSCAEYVAAQLNFESELLDKIFSKIWDFVSSSKLDLWDNEIKEYSPYVILDTHPENKVENYEFITTANFVELKNLYLSLPSFLVEIIGDSIEAGGCNLYGGTDENSPCSLGYALNVYKIMTKNKFSLPSIENFQRSSFTENQGWGNPRDKSFFLSP